MNKVILIGRLTADPELNRTNTDIPVVRFTLAVNRNYQSNSGERQADFITCIAWRAQAENLARYIKKGGLVAVDGSIQTRSYDDQNGVRKYVTEVVCNQITFLESKKDNNYNGGYNDFNQLTPPEQKSYNRGSNYNHNNGYSNNNYNNSFGGYNQQPQDNNEKIFNEAADNYDIAEDDLPPF